MSSARPRRASTRRVAYGSRIFDSIDQVDLSQWRMRSACNGSIVGDPRFIAAVEAGIRQVDRSGASSHDETGAAVACTTAAVVTIDLADLADPRSRGSFGARRRRSHGCGI